jgi:hypothetical protein
MDIREAIEKAGPGGKIHRECWPTPFFIEDRGICWSNKGEDGLNPEGEIAKITVEDATATDWQVVEETIEVGGHSTRRATMKDCQLCNEPPNCSTAPHPCNIEKEFIGVGDTVRRFDAEVIVIGMDSDESCIQYDDNSMEVVQTSGLTLIRKGEKHVFEQVEWLKVPARNDGFFPVPFNPRFKDEDAYRECQKLCENGKRYRMTLEPMED